MPSLGAHLRQTDDHSGLPFHPSCPVCRRDRLAGTLSSDELVSSRTRAAIAVGLLAFSGVGAPAAVAAGPDQDIEGSTEVIESGDPGSVDPGGETAPLPDAAPLAPEDEAPPAALGEEAAPTEPEPAPEVEEPVFEASDETAAAPAEPPAAAEVDPVAPPPADAPTTSTAPEQGAPEELSADDGAGTKRERAADGARRPAARTQHDAVTTPAPAAAAAPAPAAAAAPTPAPAPAAAAPVTVRVVAGTSTGQASAGDRVHIVRPGESLWSIASDLLGDRASVARVAREVNRLWQLNDDRIGSGNPDLLYAGTRLRLR